MTTSFDVIASLRADLAAAQEEIAEFESTEAGYIAAGSKLAEQLAAHKLLAEQQNEQLAASQLVIQQMLHAIAMAKRHLNINSQEYELAEEALSLQPTTEALEAYVKERVVAELESIAEEAPINGNNMAQARILLAAQQFRARKDKQ